MKGKWYEMIEVLNEFQDAAANDCKLQALKRWPDKLWVPQRLSNASDECIDGSFWKLRHLVQPQNEERMLHPKQVVTLQCASLGLHPRKQGKHRKALQAGVHEADKVKEVAISTPTTFIRSCMTLVCRVL